MYPDRAQSVSIRPRGGRRSWRGPVRSRGVALVVVLVLSASVVLTALVLAYSARTEMRIAKNQYQGLQALYSAEAGFNHVFRLLAANPTGFNAILAAGGTGGVLTNVGTGPDVALAGENYRFRAFGGTGSGDGYYVRLADNVDENPSNTSIDTDKQVMIVAVGQAGEAERRVQGLIRQAVGFCLFGTGSSISIIDAVKLSGGSTVDSFDSSLGSYAATAGSQAKVGTNGNVKGSGGATIQGDVTAVGTITAASDLIVTGTSTTGIAAQSFTAVPACSPYSDGTGITCSLSGCDYDSATGVLNVSGGNWVTLAAGTYCFSDITLSGGSQLTVNTGPVIVNMTGSVNFSGGSVANNTLLAANLRFSSSYSGSTKHVLSGGSGSYMTLYSPNAPVDISGGSNLYGSIVGTVLNFSGGSGIHCDNSATGGGGAGLELVSFD